MNMQIHTIHDVLRKIVLQIFVSIGVMSLGSVLHHFGLLCYCNWSKILYGISEKGFFMHWEDMNIKEDDGILEEEECKGNSIMQGGEIFNYNTISDVGVNYQ